MLLPPPSLLSPSLLTGKPLRFYPAEHFAEAFVLVEDPDVVDRVSSCDVEEHQGENYLLISPPSNLHVHMGADRISHVEDRGEVEVDGKAGEGGQPAGRFLFFVLVREDTLWHNRSTSLVVELVSQPYSIIPVYQGQRGFSLFLAVNRGSATLFQTPPDLLVLSPSFALSDFRGFSVSRPDRYDV